MDQYQKSQQILSQIQAILKRSDNAINVGRTNLEQLQRGLEIIAEKNETAQAAIDEQIVQTIQDMDEVTVKFIKDTE